MWWWGGLLGQANCTQLLKILREGLGDAFRVVDGYLGVAQGGQREAHGHAVVVVGIDGRRADALWRSNLQVVPALIDLGAHLARLGSQGRQPVRLLHSPVVDVADNRLAPG